MESEGKEYPKFVASMRKTHTILIPSMLPFHMALFEKALLASGYKVEIMKNEGADVVTEGLKYVHNDTCYPALLVIGQFIDNLNHRTDHDKLDSFSLPKQEEAVERQIISIFYVRL